MFIDKTIEYIYKKYAETSAEVKKTIALVLVAVLILTAKGSIGKKKEIYLVDLENKYENTAVLLDENGKEIIIDTDNRNVLLAIVDAKKTKKGEKYPIILVDDKGIVNKGYMDGKYLENKAVDKIEYSVTDGIENLDIYNVIAKKGAYLRNNKIVDKNTDDAELLSFDEKIVSSGISEVSDENNYNWLRVIRYDEKNKTLSTGYMASDFILNDDYELASGKKFIVNTGKINLKLRESHDINSDIIAELKDGTEVILIPKFSSVSDDKYDWFYIACQIDGEWKYGYSAATYYKEDGEIINYLQESNTESVEEGKKYISKEVDTSSVSNVDLKLREKPGLNGKIVSKIANGTNIYIKQESINSPIDMDGFLWVEAETLNGDVGYVALEYIKDKKAETHTQDLVTIDFVDGVRKGYIGIDVNNTITPNQLSKLLQEEHNYKFNIPNYKINNSGPITVRQTPDFVYLKLGATGTKTFSFPVNNEGKIDDVAKKAKLCERHNVPYGYYYYSQATNKSEIEEEVKEIKKLLNSAGTTEYNVLPIAIDFEDQYYSASAGTSIDTRIKISADNKGKAYQTSIINELMNRVREETKMEVILYTDNNTLNSTFKFKDLDDINQRNCWIVETSKTHTKNLVSLDKKMNDDDKITSNRKISQVLTDTSVAEVGLDINFMDHKYLIKSLQKIYE